MTDPRVRFVVIGKPEPGGSKGIYRTRDGRAFVADANSKSKPWKRQVAIAARVATDGRPPFEGPVGVRARFILIRGKTVKRAEPTVKPDATKLWRPVEDALTGILWLDDAQVVHQWISKEYQQDADDPPRVELEVYPIAKGMYEPGWQLPLAAPSS